MKTLMSFTPIALTNQQTQGLSGIAACVFEIGQIQPDSADSRVQLLPDGQFKAKDGRPYETNTGHWLMDELAFRLIRTVEIMGVK